ncbi:MAG: hypothetical protein QOC56_2285 [Alphaproteobacteria bacterium]|nr:hypothetical protein [Alphaproteobacteria bacterium]
MQRRHDQKNVPIELLRTLITISDYGSFTKAGRALNISQPGISAQIKRLQAILGVDVFTKSGSNPRLTEYGAVVVGYAQRILALNDQILAFVGQDPVAEHIRFGLPNGIGRTTINELITGCAEAAQDRRIQFHCDNAANLSRGLCSGYLDVAFIIDAPQAPLTAVSEWMEELVWVKAPHFSVVPDAPVALVSWPGSLTERAAIKALEDSGIPYYLAFKSPELTVRTAAVLAGAGVSVVTKRAIVPGLRIARDKCLPALPNVRSGIYLREDLDVRRIRLVLAAFQSIVNPAHLHVAAIDAEAGISVDVPDEFVPA